MKTLHTVVAVVGIALAGSLAWWWQQHDGPSGVAGRAASEATSTTAAGTPAGGRPGAAGPAGPVAVEVGRAQVVAIDDDASALGALRARQSVIVRPEIGGRVVTLGFIDGQRVAKGQLLVQLDDRLQQAQLQQAKAQASIARTNLQRNRELVAQGFISQSAVDQSASSMEVAEAQVALAEAQLARARVLAPFAGTVGIRTVSVGDYVREGVDLVAIEDTTSMWVDYRLPERYIARVRTGQSVEVALDAAPQQRLRARVEALDVQVDANGRSLLVRARVDNPGGMLRSGMFARTRTVFDTRPNAIVVPEESLVPLGDKQYVIKVVDAAGGKVSQRVEVRVGQRLPGKVEVLQGLVEGDLVVTAGQARLLRADGLPLRVVEVGAGRGGAPAAAEPGAAASAPRRGASAV